MKMPVLFLGHGSPMIAIEKNSWTENFQDIGKKIIEKHGQPKGILMVSAHWFTKGFYIQDQENPKQIYDMYGFPAALYEVKYPVKGSRQLSQRVQDILGQEVEINNEWGIDHGAWSVLVHVFPKAGIPVVQLSVDARKSPEEVYEIGVKLSILREEGYLLMASGNIVHNLYDVKLNQESGNEDTLSFDKDFTDWVVTKEKKKYFSYEKHPSASYAVPTVDHLYPVFYALGASLGQELLVMNQDATLNSISMTSYIFSL